MAKKPQGWFSDSAPSRKRGEGAYSDSTLNFQRPEPYDATPRDVSKTVDAAWKINKGFSGKLSSD